MNVKRSIVSGGRLPRRCAAALVLPFDLAVSLPIR